MAAQQDHLDYDEESFGSRLLAKAQRNPFLVVGLAGFVTTLGIGAYRFKTRSKAYPMSLFFIQLRVAAQSVIIGTLTIGMTYGMLNEYVFNKNKTPEIKGK